MKPSTPGPKSLIKPTHHHYLNGLSAQAIGQILLFLFVFTATNIVKSQTLFSLVSNENSVLYSYQQDFRDSMIASGYYTDHSLLVIGHVPSLQDSGQLSFSVPGRGTTFYAEGDYVDYIDAQNYTWSGRLTNEHPGEILIMREGRGIGGYVQLSDNFYTLYPAGDSLAMMFTCNFEKWEDFTCEITSSISSISGPCGEPDECSSVHDILILLSESGDEWLDQFDYGIGFQINLKSLYLGISLLSTNLALMRSEVPNHRFRFTLHDEVFQFDFDDGENAWIDVRNFSNNEDARSLRDEYRADVVTLLTNQEYPALAGIARKISAENDSAYVIAEVPYLFGPRWTLSHEIAHLSGARHDRGSGTGHDNTNICTHGFVFDDQDNISQRTILSRLFINEGVSRLNQFSNPLVEFNGAASGDEDNNNAIALHNAKCDIQNYRASPFWAIFIKPPFPICPNQNNEFCTGILPPATNYPGIGPYTYEWHYNYTGIFSSADPGTFLGTDMCETLNVPGTVLSPYVYLQLKVASSDNQKLVVVKAIKIKRENCPPDPLIRPGLNGVIEVNNQNIHHPIANQIETEEQKFQTIRLFDQLGRVFFSCSECTLTDLQLEINNNTNALPAILVYAAKTENEVIVNAVLNLRQ